MQHRHRDGRLAWGELTVTFLFDDHWNINGFHGATRNIDARKRMEAELATSRERYQQLFEHLLSGCVIVRIVRDAEGQATDLFCEAVNPAFERHSGVPAGRFVGRHISEVFGPFDPFWLSLFDQAVMTGTPQRVDRLMQKLGRHIEGVAFALEGDRAVGLFEDVTQQRRSEEEALRVQRLESVGVLAGGIAHDFNNILTGILGNISLCRDIIADPTSEPGRLLLAAEKACGRARDLTQQLLTFSRGGDPIKQDASLPELVRETAGFVLSGSSVNASYHFADDVDRVEVDRGQFARVIHNLVLNAVQAMPDGGAIDVSAQRVCLGAREIGARPAGDYVRLSIHDEGPGIPAEDLERDFDPYFSTRCDGSGLGLSVANSIVRKHGGFLGVQSRLGEGATFTMHLPAGTGGGPGRTGADPTVRVKGHGRVLVMDDDEDVREVLARMLKALGYEPLVTRDGAEAVATYRRLHVDGERFVAVIMDLTVPGGMGGREAMSELLRLDPGVRGIVISGYSNDPVMSRPRDFGFSDVIPKPVGLAGLRETLARIEASRA
jgi:signal transduction histidine kinase/CheY-like chemotaxis protein